MKNLKLKSTVIILILVITANFIYASNPTYKLTTENLKLVKPNAMEFDICLQHTNSHETKFKYILGQYFFEFDSRIANGGTLAYSIVRSDLPSNFQPRNPKVTGNQLRLAGNSVPSKENLPEISEKSPGTLIVKMRLETSAEKFSDIPFELEFRSGPENPFTKIFAYIDNQIKDVTIPAESAADNNLNLQETDNTIPNDFALFQNYPNPFNPSTNIKFDIPKLSNVKLSIYDITGREIETIVNEELQPGSYNFKWTGSQFASGIYFYRIKSESFTQTRRMILIK